MLIRVSIVFVYSFFTRLVSIAKIAPIGWLQQIRACATPLLPPRPVF